MPKHDYTVISILHFPSNSLYTVQIIVKFFFPVALRKDSGSCSPPDGALRLHADTPEAVVLLWTSDQPDTKNSDNTQQSQTKTSILPAGIEPAIPASKRPQTHALDGAATGTDTNILEYGI